MTTLINDPTSDYRDSVTQGSPLATVIEARCTTTVTKGQALAVSQSNGVFTVAAATAQTDNVIGVALDGVVGTTAIPRIVKVVVHGPALAQTADADIDAGDWVQATTSGRYTTATTAAISAANGKALGYTLEATVAADATAGDLKWIFVAPSLIAVT